MNVRLTPEETEAFRTEVERVVFIQSGLLTPEGVTPYGSARTKHANGVARDLTIFIENLMTEKMK